MNKVRRALVFADHSQFYIQDIDGQTAAETDEGYDWPEARSEEAVAVCRIGVDGPCSIAIGTARSDYVETALRVHDAEPPLVEAEHIVEADLTVPSGVVHVFGCMELPRPEHRDASLKGDSRAAGRRTFASGGSAHHREARRGETDPAAKPLKGFGGTRVMEIVEDDRSGTYRAVYTVRFADAVYVLHVFQKKSRRGIATPKQDIDLIHRRLTEAERDYRERQNG